MEKNYLHRIKPEFCKADSFCIKRMAFTSYTNINTFIITLTFITTTITYFDFSPLVATYLGLKGFVCALLLQSRDCK